MKAEFRKLRSLPTPRWTAVVVLGCALLAAIVVFFAGTGGDIEGIYLAVTGLPLWIASIVIGAWMIGVEYGQKTMRRALSADPRRIHLIGAKLVTVAVYVAVLTLVASIFAGIVLTVAAAGQGGGPGIEAMVKSMLGALAQNLVYAIVSFFLALLTRSMAGGMTVALAFGFIIDTALSAVPKVGDYSLSLSVTEIYAAIVGSDLAGYSEDPRVGRALLITLAWLAAFGLGSGLRFLRSDVN